MNKIGWIIVLILLLIVYGFEYIIKQYYLEVAATFRDGGYILGVPHIILFLFLVGWNVKAIYEADW